VQVKTNLKAGATPSKLGSGGQPGLKVQTGVKAGAPCPPPKHGKGGPIC